MDVGDFLEFEGTFHSHGILHTTPEEQRMLLVDEMLGQ